MADRPRKEFLVFSGKKADFPVWQERFMARMRKQKLHLALLGKAIITAAPAPLGDGPSENETTAFNTAVALRTGELEKLADKEDEIYCDLVTYLDAETLMFVRHDCKLSDGSGNGAKAWAMICERFSSKEKPAVMAIASQLTNLRLSTDETVSSYLLRSQELISQLRNAGEDMSDSLVNSFILQGLPSDFESFVTMEGFNVSSSSMDLRYRLQVFADSKEEKLKQGGKSNVSYFAGGSRGAGDASRAGGSSAAGIVCFKCNKVGHRKRDCKAAASGGEGGSASHASPRCGNCDKKGHTRENCWAKGGGSEGKGPRAGQSPRGFYCGVSMVQSGYQSAMFHAMTSKQEPHALISERSEHSLVVDSGCTDHMLSSRGLFSEYSLNSDGRCVRSANQSTSLVVGYGTADLVVKDSEGASQILSLKNVLHVPDHGRDLLSVRAATKYGHTVTLTDSKSHVCLSDGTHIPIVTQDNLFLLPCDALSESNAATSGPSLGLWHRRLGHVNGRDLDKILTKTGDKPEGKEGLGFCEPCALSKLSKTSVPKSTELRATSPLGRVFTDVAGPFKTSLGGCRYIVSFIDDYSRFAVLKFMHSKS